MTEDQAPKFRVFSPFTAEEMGDLETAHGRISEPVLPKLDPPRSWVPDDKPEPHWAAIFREPTTGEVEFFERHAMKDGTKDAAYRNLAKATVVGVSFGGQKTLCVDRSDRRQVDAVRSAWDRLRGRFGGAHLACVDDLNLLAGMVKDESGKG